MAKADPKSVISRLPPDLVARLDAYAGRLGLSRNAAVEQLITDGLDRADAPAKAAAPSKAASARKAAALPPLREPLPRPARIVGYDPITGAPIHGR